MQALTRFLGDTPLRVFIRLLVLSFIVGLVLSALKSARTTSTGGSSGRSATSTTWASPSSPTRSAT